MKMRRFALLALVIVMVLSIAAVASPSKSKAVEVANAFDANKVPVTFTVSDTTVPMLTEVAAAESAAKVGTEVAAGSLEVLWQQDLSAETLPVTMTFHVDGTAGVPLYVYHYNGTEWELISSGVGEDVEATFTSLSPVAVAAEKATGGGNGETSPVTGDSKTVCIAAFGAMMIVGAAFVAFRKKSHS